MKILPFNRHGLKVAFLLPLTAVLVILAAVYIYSYVNQEVAVTEEYISRDFLSAQRVFDSVVRAKTDKLSVALEAIAQDEAIKRAMITGDRQALLQRANPIFESMRKKYNITHFYFIRPDRSTFLRVHNPEMHDDVIDRFTATNAEATGGLAAGMELGPSGAFTLRVVVPWQDGDHLIGYLELGEEIGAILHSIRENLAMDLIVTMDKRYLAQQEWARGIDMMDRQGDWDLLPDSAIVFQTMPVISPATQKILAQKSLSDLPELAYTKITDQNKIFHTGLFPLSDAGGRKVGNILLLRDITARSVRATHNRMVTSGIAFGLGVALFWLFYLIIGRIEERLASSQAETQRSALKHQLLFESSRDALMILAPPSWKFTGANQATLQLFGVSSVDEFTALRPWDVSPEWQPDGRLSNEKKQKMIATAIREGSYSFEWEHQRRDGQPFTADVLLTRMEVGKDVFLQATVRDITERKQAEEQIRQLAFYDTLTLLPNRRLLNDRLEQTMAASKRSGRYGALMFLDLDNFKPLNDTHGHGVGDLLLIEVAHRLTRCVREVDTVARFGGDEFVVMLGELDADKTESAAQAGIVAEKIRAALAESYFLTFKHEGEAETTVEHHCTSSIGVVLFINHEGSPEDILKWADIAMYQAKDAGRNLIRFYVSTA